MFETWLESIYNYSKSETDATLDNLMETVSDIAEEDLKFNMIENLFDEARRIGGENIPIKTNDSQSERLNILFQEIDCSKMDLQMLSAFCTIVNPFSAKISTYDDFVRRIKDSHGNEPRFDNIFRGFRGFEK